MSQYITKLNELIYVTAKIVCDKIDFPFGNPNINTKLAWEIIQDGQIKKVRQQTKVVSKEKHAY